MMVFLGLAWRGLGSQQMLVCHLYDESVWKISALLLAN